ncbi:MAG: TetR/AcrR family transcriptional regulator [Chloroflexi bacterium]|nr:TetR/AcrR family transcriptional regulator [Chloroflexota bacterium]MCI0579060.1 TetR/AcrR family transcriptional regulator [Chloroflexota bacterium]MCI0644465.1 TetR/AcrR family transcriptional regulator [Chloroflexota bacterium]MCI0725853.1 TetR/AcrR family transcriptional regulator [Chloroflexota bacterium]
MPKTKGEQTKEMILHKAAEVFNRQGYFGASLSDIMAATGLEKGGIYNHFANKDDLALQAYDYAVGLVEQAFTAALQNKRQAIDRLLALANVFRDMPKGFPVPGGCPVHNTAVKADEAHPLLRDRARQTMTEWHNVIRRIVQRGIERGEVRPEINPDALATLFIATLEGAIMLTRLYDDPVYMNQALDHLANHLETTVRQP